MRSISSTAIVIIWTYKHQQQKRNRQSKALLLNWFLKYQQQTHKKREKMRLMLSLEPIDHTLSFNNWVIILSLAFCKPLIHANLFECINMFIYELCTIATYSTKARVAHCNVTLHYMWCSGWWATCLWCLIYAQPIVNRSKCLTRASWYGPYIIYRLVFV